jgi:transposase InsO family protein
VDHGAVEHRGLTAAAERDRRGDLVGLEDPAQQLVVRERLDVGQPYDNALAEAFNSLFKAELVRNKGPWKSIDDLEIAVAEYIDWFNHRRHGEIGLGRVPHIGRHRVA